MICMIFFFFFYTYFLVFYRLVRLFLLLLDTQERMGHYLNPDARLFLVRFYEEGFTYRQIAKKLNISLSTVRYWVARHLRNESLQTAPKSGRGRRTTSTQDLQIVHLSQNNPFLPATDIRTELQLTCSVNTVRRRLKAQGLQCHVAAKVPKLTLSHRQQRLAFAVRYRHWTVEQWRHVMFTDEKIFRGEGQRDRRVWRPPNTRYDPLYIRALNRQSRCKINVWGSIGGFILSENEEGELETIDRVFHQIQQTRFDSWYFVHHILYNYTTDQAVLAFDRAPQHMSRMSQNAIHNLQINYLIFPPKGADMNPIENVWAEMERLTRNRVYTQSENLWPYLGEVFIQEITTEYIEKLIASMPRRLEAVIAAEGHFTKY